ncbi:MAG: DUF2089 family protein [Bacilli bacterium]|nr:DUF2089 family protein [Bacilli bacterium]MBN2876161.1 DUF2089 family protein [Bacilli bacterium]
MELNHSLWLEKLEPEDLNFIRSFILASGSLKEIAKQYQVSYPTVRLRLDRLIQKIELFEQQEDVFVTLIKKLTIDDKLDLNTAKVILSAYSQGKGELK